MLIDVAHSLTCNNDFIQSHCSNEKCSDWRKCLSIKYCSANTHIDCSSPTCKKCPRNCNNVKLSPLD